MSDFLISGSKPAAIFVGSQPVNSVYVNKTLVWQAGIYVYFDGGAVNGIEWQANALTRGGNTSYAAASVTDTYLQISTSTRSTTYAHNAHVVMTGPAKIVFRARRSFADITNNIHRSSTSLFRQRGFAFPFR